VTTLARAIALDESLFVIDLSEVRLMSPATFGAVARAEDFVRRRERTFVLRASSAGALPATDFGGLSVPVAAADGLAPGRMKVGSKAPALASWVEIPVTQPVPWRSESADPDADDPRQTSLAASDSGRDGFRGGRADGHPAPAEASGGERH
jgi:hypothetical protein